MIIECVVVCKDYADFLSHTLPDNMQHVDRMVVVTHPNDKDTQRLCSKYGVECLQTTEFHRKGEVFNKWRGINLGLSHLKNADWILHLDADILLPHNFRNMLDHAHMEMDCIYGADRLNTKSYDHWHQNKHKTKPQHQWRYLVNPPEEFPVGARLVHSHYSWCPLGYFQLWHSKMNRQYPICNGSAEHGDVLFAIQWPREKRVLLPELFVYHLESDPNAPMGANWKGRKTRHYGPHKHEKCRPGGYVKK